MASLVPTARTVGAAQMLGAAAMFTILDAVIKLGGHQLNVWQMSLGRYVVGAVAVVIMARLAGLSVLGRDRKLLLLRGAAGTVSFLGLIVALTSLELSVALVLFYLFPAFAALFAPWVTRERARGWEWPLIGLAFVGAVIILSPGQGAQTIGPGHIAALIAAASAGLSSSLIRRLRSNNNALTPYFYYCLVGCVICLIAAAGFSSPIVPVDAPAWGLWLAVGLLAMAGQLMMNLGFKHLTAHVGGVLLMSEVALGALVGVLILGESPGWRTAVGSMLIVGTAAIMSLSPSQPNRRP